MNVPALVIGRALGFGMLMRSAVMVMAAAVVMMFVYTLGLRRALVFSGELGM